MTRMFRARVVRADGRTINVVQRRAHLSYCFTGCCCGRTERGYAAVPVDTFKGEWLRRKLRNVVHLTNVPLGSADAWSDALVAAAALNCTALVVDTEEDRRSTGNPQKLAAAMRATCVRLAELDQARAVQLIREIA